ncbi:hypothetical protein BDF22DRAFT_746211 [Syncephalis plumigaleata]|nr:hypothetical protein BDF22DRAFT_746211 [Syncephalis plumigaleata]
MTTQSHTADIAAILTEADAAITRFIESFYKAYDQDRQLDIIEIIRNALRGTAELGEFYARMPPTIHEVQALDCHPMPAPAMFDGPGAPPTALQLLVLVSGQVRHGDAAMESGKATTSTARRAQSNRLGVGGADNRVFSHQFILRQDTSSPDGMTRHKHGIIKWI